VSAQTYGARAGAATGRYGKYQLDVTARDVADVVRNAGGWLYDRATAGWDVTVVVTSECDVTPLRILGARTERPNPDDDATAPPQALALAASADAMDASAPLRDDVVRALKRGLAEVTLWGEPGAAGLERGIESVEHELSAAARAFKAQALRAAGVDEPVGSVETFRRRATAFLVG
jgi:hypothetical protein